MINRKFLIAMLAPFFAKAMKKEYFAPAKTLRPPDENARLIRAAKEKRERKAAKRIAIARGVSS